MYKKEVIINNSGKRQAPLFYGAIMNDWIKNAPFAVTVCDGNGLITEMNDKAGKTFEKYGGLGLIGSNLLDCHPEPAKTRLNAMLTNPLTPPNAYTIEKNGIKKLIYQFVRIKDGKSGGLVELSLELPGDIPHYIRK